MEKQNRPITMAIRRLIKAHIWFSKVSGDDTVQMFHAENEIADAAYELDLLLAQHPLLGEQVRRNDKPVDSYAPDTKESTK